MLSDWERFVNADPPTLPPLLEAALLHQQFEPIHPYVDGNGRIGRLLIALHLIARDALPTPLLYLSAYFEPTRTQYYEHLNAVSASGDCIPWLDYFLTGVAEQARDAVDRSRRLRDLHHESHDRLQAAGASGNALQVLDEMFVQGWMDAPTARRLAGLTQPTVRNILIRPQDLGIAQVVEGSRPRVYVAHELLRLLEA